MKANLSLDIIFPAGASRSSLGFACEVLRRALSLVAGLSLLLTLVVGHANRALAAPGRPLFTASLENVDVRYPNSLPNDLEIVYYADGLKTNDLTGTYANVMWGSASSLTATVNTDTNSPGYGLNGVIVRYTGPPRPDLVGQLVHFGVQLRPGAVIAHREVWWTLNGQRILRPDNAQIQWSYNDTATDWLICVQNPNPIPVYVYGARYFPIASGAPLPSLSQMNTDIQPTQFGAPDWTSLPLPGGQRVYGLPAFVRTYLRVPVTISRPIIFQIAARTVPESVLPLPPGTTGPNPDDWNGEQGTMSILTTRATEEFPEDINSDGVVGIPDFNLLRSRFGARSTDAPSGAAAQNLIQKSTERINPDQN